MQLFNFVISAAIVSVVLFTSCKKKDDDNASPNPPAQSAGFYYGENGITTLTKADSSWVNGAHIVTGKQYCRTPCKTSPQSSHTNIVVACRHTHALS